MLGSFQKLRQEKLLINGENSFQYGMQPSLVILGKGLMVLGLGLFDKDSASYLIFKVIAGKPCWYFFN